MDRLHQLFEACVQGNVNVVTAILDEGLDVDSADNDDVTALQIASANAHENLVRLLIMRGAALDKSNSYGWTPLLHAARHGHTAIVSLLLQNQADKNARTKLGANAMMLAARGGHILTCRLLNDEKIDTSLTGGVAACSSTCDFSAVMVASLHGHDAVVRYLLDQGDGVNYQSPLLGVDALMLASLNGHMTTAQILIERGADPNLTDINGHTPLEVAMLRGQRELQGYLDRKTTIKPKAVYEDMKPDIIEATKRGNLQRVQEILNDDIKQRDACLPHEGATPLMFAAVDGRLDIAQLLVEKGCDINKQDLISGWTALMQATYHGKKTVAKYLISVGADVQIAAKNGCSAFDLITLLEDVDTELYRMLASKAIQPKNPELTNKKSKFFSKHETLAKIDETSNEKNNTEDRTKPGLKTWWNRMSNQFRNLKLGRTFGTDGNQVPTPDDKPVQPSETPTLAHQSKLRKISTLSSNGIYSSRAENINNTTNAFETDSMKNSIFTSGTLDTMRESPLGDFQKPLFPQFMPPPAFQPDRLKMPPIGVRKSISGSDNISSLAFVQATTATAKQLRCRSTVSLVAKNPLATVPQSHFVKVSTGSSHNMNISPSASSETSDLRKGLEFPGSKANSSASSSTATLTAGSDVAGKCSVPDNDRNIGIFSRESKGRNSPCQLLSRDKSTTELTNGHHSKHIALPDHASPNSSLSNASTLTPSSSVSQQENSGTPRSTRNNLPAPPSQEDIGRILQKLSLERYQPVFEEQEVDMEAFLILTDSNLRELGIMQSESRRQILATINELNMGKDREKQQYQQAIASFNTTLRAKAQNLSNPAEVLDFNTWETDHPE